MIKHLYLCTFNVASCLGWSYVLLLTLPHLGAKPEYKKFEMEIRTPLKIVQSMAFMEIIHVIFKLVPAKLYTTVIQVCSRLFIVWLVIYYRDIYRLSTGDNVTTNTIPYASDFEVGLLGCALSWSCIEVPRYLFYALDIYGLSPKALVWIRYSLFTILYPTGISSEIYSIWKMRSKINPFCWTISMPNKYNFEFSYKSALTFTLFLYAPFAPFLYKHMINRRTKAMKKAFREKNSKEKLE